MYAHNQKEAYEVRLKLYELESILPRYFNRVSKSTIANIRQIYSVDKSFSGTGTISFYQTHKEVHVSRHYQSLLKENLRRALLRRHLTSASFTALVALMIANHFYGILPIPNQTLIWAGVLIVLGVNMLTHSNRTWNGKKWWYDGEKNILIDKEVAFGTGTFYKQDQELVEDQVEVGFGNAKIYYDNA
ncbi:LytTR family DNA-binding domain-containing protein, partial [Streptococcus pneumoniae]